MNKADKPLIQSIERAILILNTLKKGELGLSELSRTLAIHKSTVYGIISTLEEFRFVEKNSITGRYGLGVELLLLGNEVNSELRQKATPYLRRLTEYTGETTNLMVRDNEYSVYLEKIESTNSMQISSGIGEKIPLYMTAGGKALLSTCSEEQIYEIFKDTEFISATANTLKSVEDVVEYMRIHRNDTVFYDREEKEYGLTCVAVPIKNKDGNAIGAISVSGPSYRLTEINQYIYASKLVKYAETIRRSL